jgi:hypothetical protein
MKARVTAKQVRASYLNIIQIGYCDAYYLLGRNPHYYTAGVYGWNADVYHIDQSMAIVTGYRPFGNIRPPYELVRKYEQEAAACYKAGEVEEVSKLLNAFVKECKAL